MTEQELQDLRRLAEAATPGPWYSHVTYHERNEYESTYWMTISLDEDDPCDGFIHSTESYQNSDDQDEANFRFIAAARTAMPQLLDEITRLHAELATLRTALRAGAGHTHSAEAPDKATQLRTVLDKILLVTTLHGNPLQCLHCDGIDTPPYDFEHATDCPVAVGRALLEATDG